MKKVLGFFVLLVLMVAAIFVATFSFNNVNSTKKSAYLFIPTGSDYTDLVKIMNQRGMLIFPQTFDWIAKLKGYDKAVKPGRYYFSKSMNNREIVNMLKSGVQSKVKLNMYNIQTKENFANAVAGNLELEAKEILTDLNSDTFCARYGCSTENILTHFIYSNFEVNWNVSKADLFVLFDQSYQEFWNRSRLEKATVVGYKPDEVTILASIVEKECMKEAELSKVAGVYLNRLRIGMPLQADPTLKFAMKDFDAQRVTNKHKEINSAYNTYANKGLPPGPICIPRKKSIDAVLDFEIHDYIYFCANPDMSGFSIFSKTLEEQNRVAIAYRKKLNEMNIH